MQCPRALGLAARFASFLFAAAALASTARAQTPPAPGADTMPLPALAPADRTTLAPLLDRGPVALVSFAGDEVPSVLVAVDIRAPAASVAALIADPSSYPRFVSVIHDVHVTGTHAQSTAYDWTWHTSVLELHGQNELDAFAPPAGHEERGWRYNVRTTSGDLGRGRIVWRVVPQGPSRTLLTIAMRLDLREASWLGREMSGGGRSVNRAISLSLATVLALGTRREAERVAGAPARAASTHGDESTLVWPTLDPDALRSTLATYDLAWLELDEHDRLVRAWSMGRTGAHHEAVTTVMHDPASFGSALTAGADAHALSSGDDGVLFDWGVSIPLFGTSGRMRLQAAAHGDAVTVRGVTGALHDGRWRFEQRPARDGEVFLFTAGDFDIADSAWVVRALVDGCPDLAVGLAAAAEVMSVRAVRLRAMALEQATPEPPPSATAQAAPAP